MIRVVLADDHPILREGLHRLLEGQPDMRVVREVADGRQALQALSECEVDVLVLDLSLPRVSGIEVLRRARLEHPGVRVVVLSMYPADQYQARVRELGAAAYVCKEQPPAELLRVLRAIAAGRHESESAGEVTPEAAPPPAPPHERLTAREHQVFTMIALGQSVAEIAAELDLTSSTVSTHLAKIREKLGVHTVAEIVHYARDAGISAPPPRRR